MKTLNFTTNEEWMAARRGKITGSRLKDIVVLRGDGEKVGFYEIIAERLGLPADEENPMARGHRLEGVAIDRFEQVTGKKVDRSLVMWTHDDNDSIAVSPDGFIKKGKKVTEAVEAKCLSSARHIEAIVTKKIPKEYEYQKLQYFVVNPDLQKLHFCFFDDRLQVQDFIIFEVNREDVQEDVDVYLQYQKDKLEKIEAIVKSLSF